MPNPKHCVYVLRSLRDRSRYYTGVTSDLKSRLATHNGGGSPHTATGTPWEIDVLVQFTDGRRALAFADCG
jgi:predicted GIY-YIG superfamily endonuclease